MAYACSPNQS